MPSPSPSPSPIAAPTVTLPMSVDDFGDQSASFLRDATIWVSTHWLHILLATGIAILMVLALRLVRGWGVRMCERGNGAGSWYSIFGRAIGRTGNFFIIMAAVKLVVGYARAPEAIGTTTTFLFTIAAVFQAAVWVREFVFGLVESRTIGEGASEGIANALGIIRLLVSIVVFAIALVVVLGNLGVNVTGLIAGLGVGGIAIGLAAQGVVGDLFAALSILFDRPFRIGELIRFGTTTGTVEWIGLKSTRIRATGGELHIIANKQLLDKEIENLSDRKHIRTQWIVPAIYFNDPAVLEKMPKILADATEQADVTLVSARFHAFTAATLDYELVFDVAGNDVAASNRARDAVAAAVLKGIAEAKIDLSNIVRPR